METGEQTLLRFDGFDIIRVDFTNQRIAVGDEETKLNLVIVPKLHKFKSHPLIFKIVIEVSLDRENIFSLKVAGIGHFQFSGDTKLLEEEKQKMANVNATAMLFPYLRAFISTLTINLGPNFGAIILPTQFFKGPMQEVLHEKLDQSPSANNESIE